MSLTPLSTARVHTRVVTLAGPDGKPRRIVLRFRWNTSLASWQMAAAPAGRRKVALRWVSLRGILEESFGLDFGEKQLELEEA